MEINPAGPGPGKQKKSQLRKYLKHARGTLSPEQRREFDRAIHTRLQAQVEAAGTVFCYVSTAVEVDTRVIIDQLRQLGKTVLIPRIIGRERMVAVRFDGWDKLQVGQLGILTPENNGEWQSRIDLCITPGLGFAPDGKRIGFGKGYYDKWFAAHPSTARTAICYECQIVATMPTTETDVAMHRIVTEQRTITCPLPLVPGP